jgi:hypothetical protein
MQVMRCREGGTSFDMPGRVMNRKRVYHTLLAALSLAILMSVIMIALPVKIQSWRVAHADAALHYGRAMAASHQSTPSTFEMGH